MSTLKLNIGSARVKIPGYINIDRTLGTEAYPLPLNIVQEDGSCIAITDEGVQEVRASHVLEHFSFDDVPKVLGEWSRVLAPGGRMFISVPDYDKVSELRKAGDARWRLYLMGGQTHANDYHQSVFDRVTLREHMLAAGLEHIQIWDGADDTSRHPCSLNLMGIKPMKNPISGPPSATHIKQMEIKIMAVCSIPRLGFNDHWGCIHEALQHWNIPLRRFTGAYWGQCMQGALEGALQGDADWILTLDYDTMFSPQHLDAMFGAFGRNGHIDALAALQRKRNADTPLCTVKGCEKQEVAGDPFKVNTAHFGLTLIRAASLRKLPLPYFAHEPGPDGTWTHFDHIDDDIFFWKSWERAGLTCYVHPDVRIGHLEMMVTGFDEYHKPECMTVGAWYNKYKPETLHTGLG